MLGHLCLKLPVQEAYLPRPKCAAIEKDWQLLSPVTTYRQKLFELTIKNTDSDVELDPTTILQKWSYAYYIFVAVNNIINQGFLKFRMSWQICPICLIFLPNWKKWWMPMVIHVSIIHGLGCLTSEIWPFILPAITFGSFEKTLEGTGRQPQNLAGSSG